MEVSKLWMMYYGVIGGRPTLIILFLVSKSSPKHAKSADVSVSACGLNVLFVRGFGIKYLVVQDVWVL